MSRGEWAAPQTREHTFATGRTATLRIALPMSHLLRTGLWTNDLAAAFDQAVAGDLDDPALAVQLNDSIVFGMFVDPRIVPDDQVDASKDMFPISVLEESEINETIDAAFGGPAGDASFPGVEPGVGPDADSTGVADDAGDAAGPGAGQPRRRRARRADSPPRASGESAA